MVGFDLKDGVDEDAGAEKESNFEMGCICVQISDQHYILVQIHMKSIPYLFF